MLYLSSHTGLLPHSSRLWYLRFPLNTRLSYVRLIPILPKDLRLFYVLDSFCGQVWLARDSPEIVSYREITENAVPNILVYHTSEEYVSNGLSSFPTWTGYTGDV